MLGCRVVVRLSFGWVGVEAVEHDISNKNPKSKIDIDIAVKLK